MNKKIIAERLSKALNDSGLGQRELAEKSHLTESSISHYINGRHAPSKESAEALAKVLNVTPAWLLGFDVPKEEKYSAAKRYYHETDAIEALFASAGWNCEDIWGDDEIIDYTEDGEPICQPVLIGFKLSNENSSLTISSKDYDELKDEVTKVFQKKFLEIVTKNLSSFMEEK